MNQHHRHCQRHSIFCILPPHLIRSISERGSKRQREIALRTSASDATFRAMRAAPGFAAAPAPVPAAAVSGKQRTIYSAGGQETLPGTVVRTEGSDPSGDVAVDEAYDGLGSTYDMYLEAFARNSIDDEGLPLDATVHYGQNYNNAFWNGQRMVFGDGDDELFNRFTIAIDIIGHELTHGVTEDESGLVYFQQPGALNESLSDVFGSLVKQFSLQQDAAQADWLIGKGLFTEIVNGDALRSMKAPGTAYDDPVLGKDPQPGHMNDFVNTWEDNGGVHINSGIPNRAYYLVATNLGGNAWEKAGRIWYDTARDPGMRRNTGFRRFARLTLDTAERLYGFGSSERQAVRDAWQQVGISLK
jgi:Zn-dependent metalloprotease